MVGATNGDYRVVITDSSALATARLVALLPFEPSEIFVNVRDGGSASPQRSAVQWTNQDKVSVTGGLETYGVGSPTRVSLTTTSGLLYADDGKTISYNNPATPTYQDEDGAAVLVGQIADDQGDFLSRTLPQVVGATAENYQGRTTKYSRRVELPTAANNARIRGDGNVIEIIARR